MSERQTADSGAVIAGESAAHRGDLRRLGWWAVAVGTVVGDKAKRGH